MPCYQPLRGYRALDVNPDTGKRPITFNANKAYTDLKVTLPCGQCIGCRLDKSRQWAIRCSHEADLYEQNSFITLTYNDGHLPPLGSLQLRDFQLFMKRLRKKYGPKIRFFHCGEYGEKFLRPHYHACLFNHDFEDKTLWQIQNKVNLYRSAELEKLWSDADGNPIGYASTGDVTFQSAAYVARYILKKITGDQAVDHYLAIDPDTGEILGNRAPEYTTMSRRPGIGHGWFSKYSTDVFPSDEVIIKGKKMRPPKYYDRQYELTYPSDYRRIRARRIAAQRDHPDNTPERLKVREIVQQRKLEQLPRKLE